jgi:hypothetical protein
MGVAPWLKVYIADEMCSGRFFISVILLVDGLHELYAGTAGGGQVIVALQFTPTAADSAGVSQVCFALPNVI